MPQRRRDLTRAEVHQLTVLRQSLRNMVIDLHDAVVPEALAQGARVLRDIARQEAPVESGFLRDHIDVHQNIDSRGNTVFYVRVGEEDFVGHVYYAGMVHYGTSRMPPNPFMDRALDLGRSRVLDVIANAIERGIE